MLLLKKTKKWNRQRHWGGSGKEPTSYNRMSCRQQQQPSPATSSIRFSSKIESLWNCYIVPSNTFLFSYTEYIGNNKPKCQERKQYKIYSAKLSTNNQPQQRYLSHLLCGSSRNKFIVMTWGIDNLILCKSLQFWQNLVVFICEIEIEP